MVSLRADSLSSRLGSLEERVFGVDNHDLIQKQLSRGTDPFYKRIEKLQEDAYETFQSSFATFLEKYENSPVYIESPNYISPSGLTVQETLLHLHFHSLAELHIATSLVNTATS